MDADELTGVLLGRDAYGEACAEFNVDGVLTLRSWDERGGYDGAIVLTSEMVAKLASLLTARATPSAPPAESTGIALRAYEALRGLPAFVDVQAHGGSLYVSISDPTSARHYPGHVDGWELKFLLRPAQPAPVSDEAMVIRVHEAMQNAPHDGKPYRQARAAIAAMPSGASGAEPRGCPTPGACSCVPSAPASAPGGTAATTCDGSGLLLPRASLETLYGCDGCANCKPALRPANSSGLPAFAAYPTDRPPRRNAGILCDMWIGPCACGAWHHGENDSLERSTSKASTP